MDEPKVRPQLYDSWKENPYCIDCNKPIRTTKEVRCKKCKNGKPTNRKKLQRTTEKS